MTPYPTPTGEPCPRQLRADGSLEGTGACYGCGSCLLLEQAAWPSDRGASDGTDGRPARDFRPCSESTLRDDD